MFDENLFDGHIFQAPQQAQEQPSSPKRGVFVPVRYRAKYWWQIQREQAKKK